MRTPCPGAQLASAGVRAAASHAPPPPTTCSGVARHSSSRAGCAGRAGAQVSAAPCASRVRRAHMHPAAGAAGRAAAAAAQGGAALCAAVGVAAGAARPAQGTPVGCAGARGAHVLPSGPPVRDRRGRRLVEHSGPGAVFEEPVKPGQGDPEFHPEALAHEDPPVPDPQLVEEIKMRGGPEAHWVVQAAPNAAPRRVDCPEPQPQPGSEPHDQQGLRSGAAGREADDATASGMEELQGRAAGGRSERAAGGAGEGDGGNGVRHLFRKTDKEEALQQEARSVQHGHDARDRVNGPGEATAAAAEAAAVEAASDDVAAAAEAALADELGRRTEGPGAEAAGQQKPAQGGGRPAFDPWHMEAPGKPGIRVEGVPEPSEGRDDADEGQVGEIPVEWEDGDEVEVPDEGVTFLEDGAEIRTAASRTIWVKVLRRQ